MDELVVLDRVQTPRGELRLRRRGEVFEVLSAGVPLMDTRDGRSERLLVDAAVAGRAAPLDVLVGGLGVGSSLLAALACNAVRRVTLVELEPALLGWHRTHLAAVSRGALDDPRVRVVCADVAELLRGEETTYDAICLDVDNGPDWTVTPGNARLYGDAGLELLAARLRPGGVLTVWSAAAAPGFEARLRCRFADVSVLPVEVARGEPDLVYRAC